MFVVFFSGAFYRPEESAIRDVAKVLFFWGGFFLFLSWLLFVARDVKNVNGVMQFVTVSQRCPGSFAGRGPDIRLLSNVSGSRERNVVR